MSFFTRLNTLLSLPSVSSTNSAIDMSNLGVIHELASWFSALGFHCEVIPLAQSGKANLLATTGQGPGGLVLSGHTDTVPFDESLWQMNPLALTQRDNRLYGLGSTDMKGFFAVVYEAVKDLELKSVQHPLIILATADEESSMNGARALATYSTHAQRSVMAQARAALIGEPTNLRAVNRHKGMMMERLHVKGQSGHSSNPTLGRNALEAMHEMISALLKLRRDLQKRFHNSLFEVDVPTMNMGVIHGGDNPNRICGHCSLEFDVRLMPGMGSEMIRTEIVQLLQPIASRHQVEFSFTPLFPGLDPFFNNHSDLVLLCQDLIGTEPISVGFGTEAPFLQALGMDTVVLGPGSIDVAHQPNEYMPLAQVQPCITLLQQLIRRYCLEN